MVTLWTVHGSEIGSTMLSVLITSSTSGLSYSHISINTAIRCNVTSCTPQQASFASTFDLALRIPPYSQVPQDYLPPTVHSSTSDYLCQKLLPKAYAKDCNFCHMEIHVQIGYCLYGCFWYFSATRFSVPYKIMMWILFETYRLK